MNTFKKIKLGLGLGIAALSLGTTLLGSIAYAAIPPPPPPLPPTPAQIKAASNLGFTTDFDSVTVTVAGRTLTFTFQPTLGEPAMLNQAELAKLSSTAPGSELNFYVVPADTFCTPGGNAPQIPVYNAISIQAGSIKFNAAGTAVTSAAASLAAYGETNGVCSPTESTAQMTISSAAGGSTAAQAACQGQTGTALAGCVAGYDAAIAGTSEDKACSSYTGADLTACQNGFTLGTTAAAAAGSAAPTCESNFNGAFAWIICPVLQMADDIAGSFSSFIQGQLCFTTTDNNATSSTGQPSCGGNNNLTAGVEKAWGIFRILASALLVIVMLVMVIAQAFGGGPFDAYTVRKLLPKMVAAVVFIQLSWVILKWGIDFSNDLGRGISELMYAPFGGSANINLDTIIGNNLSTQSTTTNSTFALFTAVAALGTLAALSFPGLLLMALFVVMALATAFFVLIFRKFLIVMLVMLAPLAFVCWILPGTERYFQMWKTNFTKLLAMFPLIMAMIAGGRIFAYIVGGTPNSGPAGGTPTGAIHLLPHMAVAHLGPLAVPYFASVTDFADFAIILVAWFGPYFLLPQTFKWGGSALSSISGGVNKAAQRAGKPAKDYLGWRKGLTPWAQARAARRGEQERQAKLGFARKLGSDSPMGYVRRARLGGIPVPTRKGLQKERDLRKHITETAEEKLREEEIKAEALALDREVGTKSRNDQLTALEAIATDPHTNEFKQQAAIARIAQLQGGIQLKNVRDTLIRNGQGEVWNRAVNGRNYDAIKAVSPALAQAADDAMIASKTTFSNPKDAEAYANQSDQVLAAMSGDGWKIYESVDPVKAKEAYERITSSGQAYAAGVSTVAHDRYLGTGVRPTTPPRPGPGAAHSPSVAPGTPEAAMVAMTDSDVMRIISTAPRPAGYTGNGWDLISVSDLELIYNYRTGRIKVQAERELRRRGIIP